MVQAIEEYSKRLSRYCELSMTELADEKTPDNASEKEALMIKDKEGEKILSKISDSAYVIALDLNGEILSSEELATFMADCGVCGNSHLVFQKLFRVILLEQIYRGFRINNNGPYHK